MNRNNVENTWLSSSASEKDSNQQHINMNQNCDVVAKKANIIYQQKYRFTIKESNHFTAFCIGQPQTITSYSGHHICRMIQRIWNKFSSENNQGTLNYYEERLKELDIINPEKTKEYMMALFQRLK